jgi:hypothetical protein
MDIILLILIIVLIGGGGWGYRTGYVGANPIGLILLVVVIVLVVGLLGPFHYSRTLW